MWMARRIRLGIAWSFGRNKKRASSCRRLETGHCLFRDGLLCAIATRIKVVSFNERMAGEDAVSCFVRLGVYEGRSLAVA